MANLLDDLIDSARGQGKPSASAVPAAPSAGGGFNPFSPQPTTAPSVTAPPTAAPSAAAPNPNAYQPPSWLPGARFVRNFGNTFEDAYTLGGADPATAKVGDLLRSLGVRNATPDVATLRAQTAQGRQDIGPVASMIADTAGYAMGPGKLLGPVAGRFAGGGIGSAALEGAATGAGSAFGHGGSLLDTLVGAGTGGLVGLGGGVVGLGVGTLIRKLMGSSGAGGITAALKTDRDAKYGALDNVFYRPQDALDMVSKTRGDIIAKDPGGDLLANAPRTSAALQAFESQSLGNPTTTGGGLGTLHRQLGEIMGGRNGGAEAEIAGPFRNRVEELMQTGQPVNPGIAPGDAADMLAKAKAAHGLYKNADMLEGMRDQLDRFGTMPGPTAKAALTDNPQFYKSPDANQAMMDITKTGLGGPSTWSLAHTVHPLVSTGLLGLGVTGHWGEALGGGLSYLAAAPALHAVEAAASRAAARRAITNAYPALTPGQSLANPEQRTGDLIKNLMLGSLSQGSGKPNPLNYVPRPIAPFVYSAF